MHKGDRYRPPRTAPLVSTPSQMDGCESGEQKALVWNLTMLIFIISTLFLHMAAINVVHEWIYFFLLEMYFV